MDKRGTPVWRHYSNGKRRAMWLKRGHTCDKTCLVMDGQFSHCKKYSYRPEGFKENHVSTRG